MKAMDEENVRKPCYNTHCHGEEAVLNCYLAGICPLFMDEQSVCCCDTPEKKKTTNADKIRAMPDEELARFLCGLNSECAKCPADRVCWAGHNGMLTWLIEEIDNG